MRKIIFSVAAAGAAIVAASPAVAQYYPGPQPYGYNNGFQGNWGQVRALQVRLDRVERQISRLDRRDAIGNRSAGRLRDQANRIEERLHSRARGGLNPGEARDIEVRIARLEQSVQFALNNRYGGYGSNGYGFADRDRDGRDDRFEDDRGSRHD
ncbi:MAG: hypothetical protein ACJ8FB_04295 [Sphingomicrobium sp.]